MSSKFKKHGSPSYYTDIFEGGISLLFLELVYFLAFVFLFLLFTKYN
jgi:hypothetical protein